jgi:hypothetical protein
MGKALRSTQTEFDRNMPTERNSSVQEILLQEIRRYIGLPSSYFVMELYCDRIELRMVRIIDII